LPGDVVSLGRAPLFSLVSLVVDLDERHKAIVREALLKCFGGI
jgi:hypothetical protein